jgi:hypothetical protein
MFHESDDACEIRVVSIYSTPWRYLGTSRKGLSDKLALGGLERHYELYKDQLPRLLPLDLLGGPIGEGDIQLAKPVAGIEMSETDAMLFALPSNQVVLAVTLAFATRPLKKVSDVEPITGVLDQSIEAEIRFRGKNLSEYVGDLSHEHLDWEILNKKEGTRRATDDALLPERHQLVFIKRSDENETVPCEEMINEILYRETPPYREEFGSPNTPDQLNVGHRTLGVVTPYVSLLYGHMPYVEDSIFLSTVHAVGTSYRFRQIWHEAYRQVRRFREKKQEQEAGKQQRGDLEELADRLGNLEFDLTFSVEFPLMRIESFQTALYEAMDLSNQAKALSQMFDQLDGSLRSEITAIDVRERRRDDGRQKWNAFAAAILSLIGVSVGFIITFLGINTTEVPSGGRQLSMWDPRFAPLYLIAGLFALTPVFLISFPYLRDWAWGRPRKSLRSLWSGLAVVLIGVALFVTAFREDRIGSGRIVVLDAVLKSLAVFTLLVGLSLTGLWLWHRTRQPDPDET